MQYAFYVVQWTALSALGSLLFVGSAVAATQAFSNPTLGLTVVASEVDLPAGEWGVAAIAPANALDQSFLVRRGTADGGAAGRRGPLRPRKHGGPGGRSDVDVAVRPAAECPASDAGRCWQRGRPHECPPRRSRAAPQSRRPHGRPDAHGINDRAANGIQVEPDAGPGRLSRAARTVGVCPRPRVGAPRRTGRARGAARVDDAPARPVRRWPLVRPRRPHGARGGADD